VGWWVGGLVGWRSAGVAWHSGGVAQRWQSGGLANQTHDIKQYKVHDGNCPHLTRWSEMF